VLFGRPETETEARIKILLLVPALVWFACPH
jgi:hypothetical protein